MTLEMDSVLKDGKAVADMKVIGSTIRWRVMAFTIGIMVTDIKVIGSKARGKVMVSSIGLMVTDMKVVG